MRFSDSDRSSNLSVSPDTAGPSSLAGNGLDAPGSLSPRSNIATNGNGIINPSLPSTNGSSANPPLVLGNGTGNGVTKHGKAPAVATVNLPGTLLYEDSFLDRAEFIRLVIQSLRDVGYMYVFVFLGSYGLGHIC